MTVAHDAMVECLFQPFLDILFNSMAFVWYYYDFFPQARAKKRRARHNWLRVKRSPLFLSLLSSIFPVSPCPILDLRACHWLFLKSDFDGKKSQAKRKKFWKTIPFLFVSVGEPPNSAAPTLEAATVKI